MQELVSVIIPMHNGRRHVRATLESVLAQTHRELEIVVVDDGSTDGSGEMVQELFGERIRMVRQAQSGHPAARNTGIRAATAELLTFIDHDDLWPEHKIAMQLEVLRDDPALDGVMAHVQNFLDDEIPEQERERIVAPMIPIAGLVPGSMMLRRAAFQRVGEFESGREMGDFLDWYVRAQVANLNLRMLPDVLLQRRIHNTNFSRTNHHRRREYLQTIKQVLDARRRAAAETTH